MKMDRSRGYLRHLEVPGTNYFLTFRLADSMPTSVLNELQAERRALELQFQRSRNKPNNCDRWRIEGLYRERVEQFLDSGAGCCWLAKQEVAALLRETLILFDRQKYNLHAWVIMPNHVHVLFKPIHSEPGSDLIRILHSWKSYTASEANKILRRKGKFWQEEYFDRIVRSEKHFAALIAYILENPIKAGLCKEWRDWRWSGVSEEIRNKLE